MERRLGKDAVNISTGYVVTALGTCEKIELTLYLLAFRSWQRCPKNSNVIVPASR